MRLALKTLSAFDVLNATRMTRRNKTDKVQEQSEAVRNMGVCAVRCAIFPPSHALPENRDASVTVAEQPPVPADQKP